ncbi:DUF4221 family protein [Algoriphagus namhaensis]
MFGIKKQLLPFFLYVLPLFGFFSCQSPSEKPISLELQPTDFFLHLSVDDSTSNISDGLTYHAESNLLFSLNWIQNSIQIYDLEEERKVKELRFDYEGPNGVLDIMGIYPHSLDSIFLFNQLESELTLIDTSGQIRGRLAYQSPDQYSPAFVHHAYFTSPPVLKGDKMIVKTHFYGNIQTMTQEQLEQKQLVYEIDLKSGATRFLDLKFPDDYMPNGLKLFEASIATGAGKHVYSLFGDHRLFYVEEWGDSLKWKEGKSAHLPASLPYLPMGADGLDFRKYSFYSPHYESMAYDPFRKLFIRFAFHEIEPDDSVPVSDWRNHSGPFSVQLFDENLDLVSEMAFPAGQYHPFSYFITEDGLYLSTNHPLNPANQEDRMSFRLIEFRG